MWEETLVFNIQMPQVALVRFQVWDHDPIGQDFIGQRTIALTSMMPGRHETIGRRRVTSETSRGVTEIVSYQRLQTRVPGGDGSVLHLPSYRHHRSIGKGKRPPSVHVPPFLWDFNRLAFR